MAGAAEVGVDVAVPVAKKVGGLVETLVLGGGVIDGVGETLGYDVIEVGVDIGLEGQHVGGGEVVVGGEGLGGEDLPDALVAVGRLPVEGDGEGVAVGRDAGVGRGEDAAGGIECLGHLVEGDVAGPLLRGVERVDGDGADGAGLGEASADGDLAYGVVADVALIVGVDEVLCGAAKCGEGSVEAGPVGGGVDGVEGWGDVRRVVEGPAKGEGTLFWGKRPERMGVMASPCCVARTSSFDIFAAANVDDLLLVEDGLPDAVGGFVLGVRAAAAGVLDVEVLHVGAEIGKAPGEVGVVADDDEGDAGQGDSRDVELAGRRGGLEVGFVPDAGHAVREVHVIGEERLAGCGVDAGDGPVVRACFAAVAGEGWREHSLHDE